MDELIKAEREAALVLRPLLRKWWEARQELYVASEKEDDETLGTGRDLEVALYNEEVHSYFPYLPWPAGLE